MWRCECCRLRKWIILTSGGGHPIALCGSCYDDALNQGDTTASEVP